jgi:signal recognition particle receptor subunit beta
MVLFNYSTRELTAKIVYYGPGICGKTTNLQFVHENLPGGIRGKMLSLATKTDRTLFFDFLPIDLGEIRGMKTRVQLYTVPGQVFYNETRKLVLKGVDGIVFVADSQETMLGANVESFKNLEENMKGHGMKLADMPHVIQFNKRDLPKLSSIEDMNAALNKYNAPFYESVATTGIGVQDTLKAIVKLVLLNLTKKYEPKTVGESAPAAAPPAAVAAMSSVAPATVAVSRAAGPVAEFSTSQVGTQETRRTTVPLSPMAPPRRSAPQPEEPISSFAEAEIDGLVDEVADIETPPVPRPAEEGRWMGDLPGDAEAAAPVWAPPSARSEHLSTESAESDVRLTHVASNDDLFSDPSLEIAKMAAGQSREILVPVMLGEGASARRFKLAIRLRLDPVD